MAALRAREGLLLLAAYEIQERVLVQELRLSPRVQRHELAVVGHANQTCRYLALESACSANTCLQPASAATPLGATDTDIFASPQDA